MDKSEKIEYIQSLSEADFRTRLLMPLFQKMGFLDVAHHHHSHEKGKDIVMKEFDPKFGREKYIAVVVKTGDIIGSASDKRGLMNISNQLRQSLNEPYKDPHNLKEIDINEVILVTSGLITPNAVDSALGSIRKDMLDKQIRAVIDITKLTPLMEAYIPEFWNTNYDTKEAIRHQRDCLLNNYSKLLNLIVPSTKEQEPLLQRAVSDEIKVELYPFEYIRKYVADIGYRTIKFDEIDTYYSNVLIHNRCGNIRLHTFKIKEEVESILYKMNEVIELLKDILAETDPEKVANLLIKFRRHVSSSGQISFQTEDIVTENEFYWGIGDYKRKKEFLDSSGWSDAFGKASDHIIHSSLQPLKEFYQNYPEKNKKMWMVVKVEMNEHSKEFINTDYKIIENGRKEQTDKDGFTHIVTENLYKAKDMFILEVALNYYPFLLDKVMTEAKFINFWSGRFQELFDKAFFNEYFDAEVED